MPDGTEFIVALAVIVGLVCISLWCAAADCCGEEEVVVVEQQREEEVNENENENEEESDEEDLPFATVVQTIAFAPNPPLGLALVPIAARVDAA